MKNNFFKATCLCESVQFDVELVNLNLGLCHCSMCRKSTGGTGFSYLYSKNKPNFISKKWLKIYDSSPVAERGFCKNCGTSIFYHRKLDEGYCIPPAIIKDLPQDKVCFSKEWYIENKPYYYEYKTDK